MLSNDELANGMPFILRLWDAAGVPKEWAETLRGAVARRWYDIYRRSDWEALRREASAVFRHVVDQADIERASPYGQRRVVIHTTAVSPAELGAT
jgi:hypothetical protein